MSEQTAAQTVVALLADPTTVPTPTGTTSPGPGRALGAPIVIPKGDPRGTESILSFFSADDLGRAMLASGWTVEQETEILVQMACTDEDPKVRLAAIEALRKRQIESLRFSGHLAERSARIEFSRDGGSRSSLIESEIRIVSKASEQATKMLEAFRKEPVYESLPSQHPQRPDEQDFVDAECVGSGDGRPESAGPDGPDAGQGVSQETGALCSAREG